MGGPANPVKSTGTRVVPGTIHNYLLSTENDDLRSHSVTEYRPHANRGSTEYVHRIHLVQHAVCILEFWISTGNGTSNIC